MLLACQSVFLLGALKAAESSTFSTQGRWQLRQVDGHLVGPTPWQGEGRVVAIEVPLPQRILCTVNSLKLILQNRIKTH